MKLKLHAALAALAAVCLSLGGPGYAVAAEKTSKSTKSTKTTAPAKPAETQPVQNAAPPMNSVAQGLARLGVNRCLPRIEQFTSFLTANSQTGVMLFADPAAPDRLINSVSLEIQTQNALTYASATFAPDETGNGCGGTYEAVSHWRASCNDVAAKNFNGFKQAKPLRQTIATLEGGPQVRVFLLPTAQGCISIKKEVVF